ncbi:LRP5L [Cordylochernes scorpioides]|uniref:LRP5L n=1 Tax=Cordylochernes scorpioides TaxID=51811 RepID=A0ABY6LAV3_9ARAC|nr:LRP5L [Cordylochernes scorpioides]
MYWTELGPAGIYKARLDGSDVTPLVTTDVTRPAGLALDWPSNELYWSDVGRIEAIDLTTRVRRVVVKGQYFKPTGVAVFEDRLYWNQGIIFSAHKLRGNDHKDIFHLPLSHANASLKLYHQSLISNRSNLCWGIPCSHVCISTSDSFKCLCPPEYTLVQNKDCRLEPRTTQIYALVHTPTDTYIYRVLPNAIGGDRVTRLPLSLNMGLVGGLAYDAKRAILYVAIGGKILSFETANRFSQGIVYLGLGTVKGLCFDHRGSNLIWATLATIQIGRSDGNARAVLARMNYTIKDLQVVPDLGLIFVALESYPGRIVSLHMNGSFHKTQAYTKGSTSLAFHLPSMRLFWIDSGFRRIFSTRVFRQKNTHRIERTNILAYSIAVSNSTLFWSERCLLNSVPLAEISGDVEILPVKSQDSTGNMRLFYADTLFSGSFGCARDNGGCNRICLSLPLGRVQCTCPTTMTLDPDGKSCRMVQCEAEEFRCHSGIQCISKTRVCDDTRDCNDGSDEAQDCKRDCGEDELNCGDRCLPKSQICDGTKDCSSGLDEEHCDPPCHPGFRQCLNGTGCVYGSWWCDQREDCPDGSDEADCQPAKCPEGSFRCNNSICIEAYMVCDRNDDCQDNSDEANCKSFSNCDEMICPDNSSCLVKEDLCNNVVNCLDGWDEKDCNQTSVACRNDQFSCDAGKCHPLTARCNGIPDCYDGTDEDQCLVDRTEDCTVGQFQCGDGGCIAFGQVCDGHVHCADYSDEGYGCAGCQINNGGCRDRCIALPDGPRCACRFGYELRRDNVSCRDVDECRHDWGLCSHTCINTEGSYRCECQENYSLDVDRHFCKVTKRRKQALLVVLDKSRIVMMNLSNSNLVARYLTSRESLRGLHCNAVNRRELFWTDSSTILSLDLDSKKSRMVVRGVDRPTLLQWDWIAENLYYGSPESIVGVCNRAGSYCATVRDSRTPRPPF